MTVSLTIMKTVAGSAVADSLLGSTTGYDFGFSENGDPAPAIQHFFIKHDGSNAITNLAVNVQAMSGTYGGDYSGASDLAKLKALGDVDYGLQIDFRWDASVPFDVLTNIATGIGDTFITRLVIPVESMSRNNSGTEVDAGTPVAGSVGAAGNTTLGDRAHMRMRYLSPAIEAASGYRQWDTYFSYNFTT